VLGDARVTRVAWTAIGAESGLTSRVVRLRLTYSAAEPASLASLVAKLASADPAVRMRQHRAGGNCPGRFRAQLPAIPSPVDRTEAQ